MQDNSTQYEVANKTTGEVSPVYDMATGDGWVDVKVQQQAGAIGLRFDNILKDGNLVDNDDSNDHFVIRQVGKQLTPNNDGVITDEGKENGYKFDTALINISQNTRKAIDDGELDPDKDIKDENNNGVNDDDENNGYKFDTALKNRNNNIVV